MLRRTKRVRHVENVKPGRVDTQRTDTLHLAVALSYASAWREICMSANSVLCYYFGLSIALDLSDPSWLRGALTLSDCTCSNCRLCEAKRKFVF